MPNLETTLGKDRRLIAHFITMSSQFWRGSARKTAWLLSSGFYACLIVNMLLALTINRWNKHFFDALQRHDFVEIQWSIVLILVLVLSTSIVAAVLTQLRMRFQLRWREWLTGVLINRWLKNHTDRQLQALRRIDNHEARIADDGRLAVELFVDLSGGIFNAVILSVSFIFVLWQVGGSITIGGFVIPGYLVIAVIAYSTATSLLMYFLGSPLVQQVERKAASEGDFRCALMNTRENAEAIITEAQNANEAGLLRSSFGELANRWISVIGRQSRMMFLSSGNSVLAPVAALILGAPKYLAGDMTLGDLMQAAAAFVQIHLALNWMADNALSLANWSASARRVAALDIAFKELDDLEAVRAVKPANSSVIGSPIQQ